jgi:hypothetical protein
MSSRAVIDCSHLDKLNNLCLYWTGGSVIMYVSHDLMELDNLADSTVYVHLLRALLETDSLRSSSPCSLWPIRGTLPNSHSPISTPLHPVGQLHGLGSLDYFRVLTS